MGPAPERGIHLNTGLAGPHLRPRADPQGDNARGASLPCTSRYRLTSGTQIAWAIIYNNVLRAFPYQWSFSTRTPTSPLTEPATVTPGGDRTTRPGKNATLDAGAAPDPGAHMMGGTIIGLVNNRHPAPHVAAESPFAEPRRLYETLDSAIHVYRCMRITPTWPEIQGPETGEFTFF